MEERGLSAFRKPEPSRAGNGGCGESFLRLSENLRARGAATPPAPAAFFAFRSHRGGPQKKTNKQKKKKKKKKKASYYKTGTLPFARPNLPPECFDPR